MIINGKSIAAEITEDLKQRVAKIEGRKPSLAFVLVGDDPASHSYIRMKRKKCEEVGIESIDYLLAADTEEEKVCERILSLNANPEVDGILVQLPLPKQINPIRVIETLDPRKDVDGFHPLNMGKLLRGEEGGFAPCTPYGVTIMLERSGIDTKGQHVVILGRSNIVGKPLAALLMQKNPRANATVTVAHSATRDLSTLCRTADILIAAMGQPHFVTADMVREGAVVIDVGINRVGDAIVGDVDYDAVAPKCRAISPVPGGVGPMTIAMLLSNTLSSYEQRQ
ncbi:MAG: Bifunctional protein FolD protein [Chlamydiae bacterium]|nr:Bifunctional protein FolD protein [Chlamydiota bacterium]